MDKPFLEFISVLADATIVIPLIDAYLGVDIITGEDLSDYERAMKGIFAGLAKTDVLEYTGNTLAIDMVANGVAYGAGEIGKDLNLSTSVIY